MHPKKAWFPIYLTLFGIVILLSDLQPLKVLKLIFEILFGITMFVSDEHLENAQSPIYITLSGMIT